MAGSPHMMISHFCSRSQHNWSGQISNVQSFNGADDPILPLLEKKEKNSNLGIDNQK